MTNSTVQSEWLLANMDTWPAFVQVRPIPLCSRHLSTDRMVATLVSAKKQLLANEILLVSHGPMVRPCLLAPAVSPLHWSLPILGALLLFPSLREPCSRSYFKKIFSTI